MTPQPVVCRFCGDPIVLDEFGVWHHAEDDAVVCAIGLDTDKPGEIAVQYALPVQLNNESPQGET